MKKIRKGRCFMRNSLNKKLDELKNLFDEILIELDKSKSKNFQKDMDLLLEDINDFIDEVEDIYAMKCSDSVNEEIFVDGYEVDDDIEELEFFES